MTANEVTVWVSAHDDTTASDIEAVINGDLGVAEFTGLAPDGTEVTVRFLRSDEDEAEAAVRDMEASYDDYINTKIDERKGK